MVAFHHTVNGKNAPHRQKNNNLSSHKILGGNLFFFGIIKEVDIF